MVRFSSFASKTCRTSLTKADCIVGDLVEYHIVGTIYREMNSMRLSCPQKHRSLISRVSILFTTTRCSPNYIKLRRPAYEGIITQHAWIAAYFHQSPFTCKAQSQNVPTSVRTFTILRVIGSSRLTWVLSVATEEHLHRRLLSNPLPITGAMDPRRRGWVLSPIITTTIGMRTWRVGFGRAYRV